MYGKGWELCNKLVVKCNNALYARATRLVQHQNNATGGSYGAGIEF